MFSQNNQSYAAALFKSNINCCFVSADRHSLHEKWNVSGKDSRQGYAEMNCTKR